jgi:hypothetical protein
VPAVDPDLRDSHRHSRVVLQCNQELTQEAQFQRSQNRAAEPLSAAVACSTAHLSSVDLTVGRSALNSREACAEEFAKCMMADASTTR